jgi:hypothetical protein
MKPTARPVCVIRTIQLRNNKELGQMKRLQDSADHFEACFHTFMGFIEGKQSNWYNSNETTGAVIGQNKTQRESIEAL